MDLLRDERLQRASNLSSDGPRTETSQYLTYGQVGLPMLPLKRTLISCSSPNRSRTSRAVSSSSASQRSRASTSTAALVRVGRCSHMVRMQL